MNPSRYDRRAFLRGLGASGALLPLLDAGRAKAADPFPRRLVVFAWSNGFWWSDFWPRGGERDFTFGKTLSPLEPYKADTIVVGGLGLRMHLDANAKALGWGKDRFYAGHDAYPAVLTAVPLSKYADFLEWSGGDSVDQYIAARLTEQGVKVPFPSLVLGALSSSGYNGTVSYLGPSPGITPEADPFRLFKKLFEGRQIGSGQIDGLRAEKRSVLDYLGQSLTAFGRRVGTDDRRKIDAHLDAIRALERQLDSAQAPSSECSVPDVGAPYSATTDVAKMPTTITLQNQLLASALRCDLTRVATVMLSSAGGDKLVFSWLGNEFVGKGDEYPTRQFHDITHNAGKSAEHIARKIRVDQWFFEQVAAFIKLLKETREGSGTMLDNTAVVITNSMGRNHESDIIPFIIVGGCGGAFKTGRYLKYGEFATNTNARRGIAHNALLTSLCGAMGVDGEKFGMRELAKDLPGLRG